MTLTDQNNNPLVRLMAGTLGTRHCLGPNSDLSYISLSEKEGELLFATFLESDYETTERLFNWMKSHGVTHLKIDTPATTVRLRLVENPETYDISFISDTGTHITIRRDGGIDCGDASGSYELFDTNRVMVQSGVDMMTSRGIDCSDFKVGESLSAQE